MLTRLRVHGFKNLLDFELRLGPLTCIAGRNGVGKSNVFDAIRFLSLLADRSFLDAAREVRGGGDLTELFTAGGDGRMELECDVLIPSFGSDDFGQPAVAASTFLSYALELKLESDSATGLPKIRLCNESLRAIKKTDARKRIGFPARKEWIDSVLSEKPRSADFISTAKRGRDHPLTGRLHQDRMQGEDKAKRGGGRQTEFVAEQLPRTVLSSAQYAAESRTVVLLRQEMRRWRILGLEPTALRDPDELDSSPEITARGEHVPATLYRLTRTEKENRKDETKEEKAERTYARLANRLSRLVEGVGTVRIEKDDARRVLQFRMCDRHGVDLPASSLSDGTMRFVALAVMEMDPIATGVLCLEEPENGIHPGRIEAMLELLRDMAVDPTLPCGDDNPLRQVIVSTHSPVVAAECHAADLVMAEARTYRQGESLVSGLEILGVGGEWRARLGCPTVSNGSLQAFLDPARLRQTEERAEGSAVADEAPRTVARYVQKTLW
jgi:predicted ATPase